MINKILLVAGFLALVFGFIYTVMIAAESIFPKQEEMEEPIKWTVRKCSL